MATIRVRFIATDGLVSRIIRKVTGSLFSHVEFGTPEGTWIGARFQGGVEERPSNYCKPTLEYVYGPGYGQQYKAKADGGSASFNLEFQIDSQSATGTIDEYIDNFNAWFW